MNLPVESNHPQFCTYLEVDEKVKILKAVAKKQNKKLINIKLLSKIQSTKIFQVLLSVYHKL